MSSDLRVAHLSWLPTAAPSDSGAIIRPMQVSDRDDFAVTYRDSYPSEIGAADLEAVEAEIDASFTGKFGTLRYDASYVAEAAGHTIGAILVVERSIWDDNLPGPFMIDLFVSPFFRRLA